MALDDLQLDADGRPTLADAPPARVVPLPRAPAGEYVSPIWPPPGHQAAAHLPECRQGCVCPKPTPSLRLITGEGG